MKDKLKALFSYKDKVQELAYDSFFTGLWFSFLAVDLTNGKYFAALLDLCVVIWGWSQMKSVAKEVRG